MRDYSIRNNGNGWYLVTITRDGIPESTRLFAWLHNAVIWARAEVQS